jgi:NADP-dependent 3-hydroxy acid dehydrogenase YdfG
MSGIQDKVILITGASSGIGESTARVLAGKGARVVLGARRTDRLEKLVREIRDAGGEGQFHTLDVTSLNDVQAFAGFALETYGRIDVVINNAGVMPLSKFEELKIDEWNRMIDVNLRGVLHGIAAALPVMRKQGHGQFVNVSSTAGHTIYATAGVYSATKSAVLALSEALRQENDRIRVTIISPGVTQSELAESVSDAGAREVVKEFRRVAIPADAIARAIGFAIEQPEGVDVSEIIVRPTANPY